MNLIKRYYPVLIVFVCCFLFSLHYAERFPFPLNDEHLYSTGKYRTYIDWGPLYSFYYSILNSITLDPLKSIYFNWIGLSFILIPLMTFLTLQNLSFNVHSSSFGALIALLSEWNLPSDSKVQIFNYILILIAFNLRWWLKKKNQTTWGMYCFYALVTACCYIRQDTLVLVIIAFFWDFFHLEKKWKIIHPTAAILITISLFKLWIESPYTGWRSVDIFYDHFWANNQENFANFSKQKTILRPMLEAYFNYPQSLWDVFTAQPIAFIKHIFKNIMLLPNRLPLIFSISIKHQWEFGEFIRVFFAAAALIIFSRGIDAEKKESFDYNEIKLFCLVFLIKSLLIVLILNWWLKYFFELSIVFTICSILLLNTLSKLSTRIPLKLVHFTWFIIPTLFIFYKYQNSNPIAEIGLKQVSAFIKKDHDRQPVVHLLSGSSFYTWPKFESTVHDLQLSKDYSLREKANLANYLKQQKIDTVILYSNYRQSMYNFGFGKIFDDFETSPKEYGFEKIFETDQNQIIYRVINHNKK